MNLNIIQQFIRSGKNIVEQIIDHYAPRISNIHEGINGKLMFFFDGRETSIPMPDRKINDNEYTARWIVRKYYEHLAAIEAETAAAA